MFGETNTSKSAGIGHELIDRVVYVQDGPPDASVAFELLHLVDPKIAHGGNAVALHDDANLAASLRSQSAGDDKNSPNLPLFIGNNRLHSPALDGVAGDLLLGKIKAANVFPHGDNVDFT